MQPSNDKYVVSVVVGGIIYKTYSMSLDQCEQAAQMFVLAAPNTSPQILFNGKQS